MTRLRVVTATIVAGLTLVMVCGVLAGWHRNADVLVLATAVVGYVWFIVVDSGLRGRSGISWLLLCSLIAPIGLPAFLFVSVRDRVRGRRGIESLWAPGVRWCYLVAVGMAAVALALAAVDVSVAKPDLGPHPTLSGSFDGSCGNSAIALALGSRPAVVEMFADSRPAAERTELEGFAQRCSAAAGRRMVVSEASLAGGLALALVGALNERRRRPVPPPPTHVTLAA